MGVSVPRAFSIASAASEAEVHFVMVGADEAAAEIRVVRNWMEEVKELLPDEK